MHTRHDAGLLTEVTSEKAGDSYCFGCESNILVLVGRNHVCVTNSWFVISDRSIEATTFKLGSASPMDTA